MPIKQYFPFLNWLPAYSKSDLTGDVSAGLTVGVMLIPQGMAYALIAGLPPVYGLYASIVPQLIYFFFGTSRQLSVAPVAMDSLLVAAGVSVLATEGTEAYIGFAILLAFFMGLFQLLLGVFRLGFVTNLLAKPVIVGFTSAAALIIGLNQLKYLLGTDIAKSNQVYEILWNALQQLTHTHWLTLLIGVSGIVLIKSIRKINRRLPGALMAVVFGTGAVYFFELQNQGVKILKEIPQGLPDLVIPDFSLGMFGEMVPLAMTIAIVAFMESYSVSKAIEAKRKNYKIQPNQELIGLGMANLVGSFFQSFPVSGGFSRSAVNNEAGANTPMASVITASLVALTLLFLTPLFYYLPETILASVILVAIAGLVDFKYTTMLWKHNKTEFSLLLATFLITLNIGMVVGIVSGIVLSILILLYRAAYPHIARLGRVKDHYEFRNLKRFKDLEQWESLLIIRVDAPLTFVNIQYFRDYIERAISEGHGAISVIVLDAGPISYMDASAIDGFRELLLALKDQKIQLLMSEVVGPVRDTLYATGLMEYIGSESIFMNLNGAVNSIVSKGGKRFEKYALQHE